MSTNVDAIREGAQLVADFQATMVNLAGAEISAAEAAQSEKLATGALQYFAGGGVLNPALIPTDSNTQIARASVDAHIKKIQAEQYRAMSRGQLADMTAQATAQFTGRKVTIRVLEREQNPIESVWLDPRRGYTNNAVNTGQLKAVIREVWLEKNALLLKPRLLLRTFEPKRKYYVAYIINPETLQPMVELELA